MKRFINRRNFIRNGTLASFGLPAILGHANLLAAEKTSSIHGNAHEFFEDIDLAEMTIPVLQEKMKNGILSSKLVTQWYLKNIEKIDKSGPSLNSVIEINPDAIAIAEAMDNERKNGKVRGALHGIPVLIKDNIDTGDKMITTAGSLALVGNHASKDAFIIGRLREAGAV
jgi:amidase